MKTLLYFEEYVNDLSKKIEERNDINIIILRAKKTIGKYISETDLLNTQHPFYIFDTEKDYDFEIKKFKKWLAHYEYHIDYLLNDSEYYLDFANKVGRDLNLEALTSQQISWVRDKYSMKQRFNEIGLKTVDYKIVKSKNDIIKFLLSQKGNPIILKPRCLMNSIDVYKITDINDLENITLNLESGKYMVESYCSDQEWSIESLIQNGKVLDSYVTYIPNRTLWAAMDNNLNCHMTVPDTPSYFKFVPKVLIQKIVDRMNLKNGAMTIEVFIDNEGNVMPSELGWRLPGCQATKNHSRSYGFDMYNSLIDIAIHKNVNLKYKKEITSVGDLYLPNKTGKIITLTPLEELLKMPGVIDGELFLKIGDMSKKRRVGNDSSGWVEVESNSVEETLMLMQNVYDNYEIETEAIKCLRK